MSHFTTTRSILLCAGLLAVIGLAPVSVPDSHAFGLGGGTAADVKSEKEIRALYADFEKAWNKHDVETMSARWAIDGDHVEPDGQVAKGRDEVAKMLRGQHSGVFKETTLKLNIRSVWMISDTVALIDGTYELVGAKLPDGTLIPPRQGMLTSVLLQERGTWSIAASRLMIPTLVPYKPKAAAAPAATAPAATAAPKQP